MGKGGKQKSTGTTTTTSTSRPDTGSADFIAQMRRQALQASGVALGTGIPTGVSPGAGQPTPSEGPLGRFDDAFRSSRIGRMFSRQGADDDRAFDPFGVVGPTAPGPDFDPVGTPTDPVQTPTGDPRNNPLGEENFFIGPDERPISEQIDPFFDPFQEQVVDATRAEFERQRGLAGVSANQQATAAGAFGGDRAAIERGARIGAIDRAETSQIAGLLSGGFRDARDVAFEQNERNRQIEQQARQEPLFRQQKALEFLNLGLGPTGTTTTSTSSGTKPGGSKLGAALGGATAGSAFGPIGTIGGALLGGLFG